MEKGRRGSDKVNVLSTDGAEKKDDDGKKKEKGPDNCCKCS